MFQRKKQGELPLFTQPKGGSGISAAPYSPRMPKASVYTIASWVWLVGSIVMIGLGIWLIATPTDVHTLDCDSEACTLTIASWEHSATQTRRFPRGHLLSARSVRIRRGEIRDPKDLRSKARRKLGYSFAVTVQKPDGNGSEEIPMSTTSLGRKKPRERVEELEAYIQNQSNGLDITESSGYDWRGILVLLFSLVSVLFASVFGQFEDPKPKSRQRQRPNSRRKM